MLDSTALRLVDGCPQAVTGQISYGHSRYCKHDTCSGYAFTSATFGYHSCNEVTGKRSPPRGLISRFENIELFQLDAKDD
jgi:hypothetical protein